MLLLLPGKAAEDMSVLGIAQTGFILGKTAHFSAITPAQHDFRRIIGNSRRGNHRFFSGNQSVDPL